MPIELGPITLAACPGTGSHWLQEVLRSKKPLGLGFISNRETKWFSQGIVQSRIRPANRTGRERRCISLKNGSLVLDDSSTYDRHDAGPCTVTIVRGVDSLVRSWFMRFRMMVAAPGNVGSIFAYMLDFNRTINYEGEDFETWLDIYLDKKSGAITALLETFTSQAKYVLNQESLADETVQMLMDEGLEFDEQAVRDYPRLGKSKKTPPEWPSGYRNKILTAG